MRISNYKKAEISYLHEYDIQNIFNNYIKGELCIDHFSINIFFGNSEGFFLSPTPRMAEELCKKDFISFDSNYKKEIYKKHTLYPWRSVQRHEIDAAINHVKEEKFGMRSGMMIVRDLGHDRFAMYSFATHKKESFEGQFHFLYHCKANYIAQMGDFMYNELLPVINEYSQAANIRMPKINQFEALNLEKSFSTDWQKDIFHALKDGQKTDLLQYLRNHANRSLKLMGDGKIQR